MHRVELKVYNMLGFEKSKMDKFLMHRVELKEDRDAWVLLSIASS